MLFHWTFFFTKSTLTLIFRVLAKYNYCTLHIQSIFFLHRQNLTNFIFLIYPFDLYIFLFSFEQNLTCCTSTVFGARSLVNAGAVRWCAWSCRGRLPWSAQLTLTTSHSSWRAHCTSQTETSLRHSRKSDNRRWENSTREELDSYRSKWLLV